VVVILFTVGMRVRPDDRSTQASPVHVAVLPVPMRLVGDVVSSIGVVWPVSAYPTASVVD
jgi:hypothetical protein